MFLLARCLYRNVWLSPSHIHLQSTYLVNLHVEGQPLEGLDLRQVSTQDMSTFTPQHFEFLRKQNDIVLRFCMPNFPRFCVVPGADFRNNLLAYTIPFNFILSLLQLHARDTDYKSENCPHSIKDSPRFHHGHDQPSYAK